MKEQQEQAEKNMHGKNTPLGCALGFYCNYPKCHCEFTQRAKYDGDWCDYCDRPCLDHAPDCDRNPAPLKTEEKDKAAADTILNQEVYIQELEQENERLKALIKTAYYAGVADEQSDEGTFNDFEQQNNL